VSTAFPPPIGGSLALDFLNTLDPWHGASPRERLVDFPALLEFLTELGAAPPEVLARLARRTAAEPAAAQRALIRIRQLRAALYRVMAASINQAAVTEADLGRVNQALRAATARHVLQADSTGGVADGWDWQGQWDEALWPVLIDAWDILTGQNLDKVKQCQGDSGACGWLFLDTSRNGTRRWCDMRTCGNRAKVRAHLARRRGG
jgi:predicted RNA-binding Zn ribbon-like protein